MKKELPIAVVLLAAGVLLWRSQSTTSFFSSQTEKTGNHAAQPLGNETENGGSHGLGDLKSDSSPATGVPGGQTNFPSSEILTSAVNSNTSPFMHAVADERSIEFLADVSSRISRSEPLQTSVRLTGFMFDKSYSASGNYYQMGQGTHKSRIQLTFGDAPGAPSVSQLCDGRFVYSLQSNGSVQSFEFVDLNRLRDATHVSARDFLPAGWVATGGISAVFQQLATTFNFGEPGTINNSEGTGNSDVILRGSWKRSAILQVMESPGEITDTKTQIPWDDVPVQIPHAVEIVFARNAEVGYFPTRITFFKFATESDSLVVEPSVILELGPPKPLHQVSDRFFVIDSSNLESVDVTDEYIAGFEKKRERDGETVLEFQR